MAKSKLQKLVDKIPNSVRITKDLTYEVVFIDEFIDGKTAGEARYDIKQIVLNKNQNNTEILRTIIHECIHVLAMESGVNLTENQVLALEEGCFQFAKLNGLFDLLAKK